MTYDPPTTAIVGSGVSGAYLAVLLVHQGRRVFLFDTKSPWEGYYGAGIVDESFFCDPVLEDFTGLLPLPSLRVLSAGGREFLWEDCRSLRSYSRTDLTEYLLKRAHEAGVTIVPSKVEGIEGHDGGWRIKTTEGEFDSAFLIGADGATSLIRKALNLFSPNQKMTLEVSYIIPQRLGDVPLIRFLDDRRGSFWFLPRSQGSAAGLWASGRFLQARDLFDRLDRMLEHFLQVPVSKEVIRSVAQISAFEKFEPALLAGDNWALVGDAAGLVDPITAVGCGIHSASVLAVSCRATLFSPASYLDGLKTTLIPLLKRRARLGRFLFRRPIMEWLVGRASTNDRLRRLLTSLVIAPQPAKEEIRRS